ncbi:hypothetical protein BN946_scf184815.g33 [Trametes cinnabarina]|uniref:Uncharacterized protein n=1 Tax=Pycnoporus cinnabarinus TaxID=5643 RepID=A0A060S2L5_PYCCI|nr:hypothetical protein BN946_scf184815.g33 [Trametes cinnabarina]
MATGTPKKLVHWALNASLSDLGSPFSDASSSASCSSTSSLQYINSQLIAHGFTHGEGLSLDGLAKEDADRVIKCVLSMLSQRIDDMSRTEDLTTKLRTLSYDHQRLTSMYKAETEKAANAEREMNMHKSRLSTVTRSLQLTESAHKQTTAELQRTRTTLTALRAAHQTEIKKIEKEKERMVERWCKLSDVQLKIGSLRSGLICANQEVVEASDVQLRGKGQGFLDVALEQAEDARTELMEQNRKLRGLLLSAANELRRVLHAARTAHDPDSAEEPSLFTSSTLFPSPHAEAAGETFTALLRSLRDVVSQKTETSSPCRCSQKTSSIKHAGDMSSKESVDVERLQAVIDKLRSDLEEAQKQAAASAAQVQELFDRFAEEQAAAAAHAGDMSVDSMTAPARDEERQRIEARFKELEEERQKFTEAAVRLGKEKAALEAERLKLIEEKRSWQVEMMLADLPPTPAPGTSLPTPAIRTAPVPSHTSPRKSPRKLKANVAGARRKTRVSRRSSAFAGITAGPSSPRATSKVMPPFETEVIPSSTGGVRPPGSPVRPTPEFKTSMAASPVPPPPFLPGSFILPPPSPGASLPSREGGGTPLPPIPPLPRLEIPPAAENASSDARIADERMDTTPDLPASTETAGPSGPLRIPPPKTPGVRPFPMAKPFAARMIHAYSPAKPSPLSRILMLANSPDSPEGMLLPKPPAEEGSSQEVTPSHTQPIRSLAEELGVSEDDDSPLRERPPAKPDTQGTKRKAGATEPDRLAQPARAAAKDVKGKGRAESQPAPASRSRSGGTLEKENVKRAKLSDGGSGTKSTNAADARKTRATTASKPTSSTVGAPATRSRAATTAGVPKPPSRLKGGARRVPAGSAEAASVPTWRG